MTIFINSFVFQAAVATPANYYGDVMLQLVFAEANGAVLGADDSENNFDWTAVGNAQVTSNQIVLDGTGDYLTLASDADDWNYIHGGSPCTFEFIVVGRPGSAHSNTLLATNAGASANRGIWLAITATGTVRVFTSMADAGNPIFDYTSTFTIPNDGALHHLVIEMEPGDGTTLTNLVRFGLDGTRQEMGSITTGAQTSISDSTADMMIGRANTTTTLDYQGNIRAIRLWRDHLPYDLLNNATYTYEADPTLWPVAEAATGFISFDPRYWPKEETAAAGRVGSLFYDSEPRFLYLGGGEILAFRNEGGSHSGNTDMRIDMFRSTDYGRHFLYSTRVNVASDATYACRNISVGRDASSGRLICFYRKADAGDVTQGVFYKTSIDSGATWSAETAVTASLTGTIPFGKIVSTTNGLMAVFYAADFAEVLFSSDGGQTWGTRTTLYDVTGTTPGYNEPFVLALSTSNLVVIARREGAGNNDFAFYKSSDGGSTWSFSSEEQWTATTYSDATPGCMELVGSTVMTAWVERGGSFYVKYTLTDSTAFFANPGRAVDGTETIVNFHSMRHNSGWTSTGAEYGYPDIIALDSANVVIGWYEPPFSSITVTRTFAAGLAIP